MNKFLDALNTIPTTKGTEEETREVSPFDTDKFEELKRNYPDVNEESIKELMTKDSEEWSDTTRNEWFASSLRRDHPDWSEEKIQELVNIKDEEEEPLNVPEIESEVKDLPPEEENEKEIEVTHTDDVTGQEDSTILDENENGEIPLDFDESQVVDPTEQEILENYVPEEPPKAEEKKEPPKEKPKAKEEKEPPKAEEKKEKSQYEYLPVGLKVAKGAVDVAGDIGNRVERVGNTQLAGSSGGADEVVRQAAIPHYDYRSFFK